MKMREVHLLAAYNAEIARGLVHTEEWRAKMKQLQAEYDAGMKDNRNPSVWPPFFVEAD